MDVQIGCVCPPKADGAARHERDTVTLRETLDFRAATSIRNSIAFAKASDPDLSEGEMLAILTEGYLLYGIEAWTLEELDDRQRAFRVPVTKPEIRTRLLADPLRAEAIGEAADVLYQPVILGPLVQRALSSSEPSPTEDESTSPTTIGSAPRRRRSKRSSTSTTPTDGIVTTTGWHGGVSNSSPSSATAV